MKEKMRGLDLFSGIGGITKALEQWVYPVSYCERDTYAQAVLLSRIQSGDLPNAPIWDDVQTLPADLPTDGIDIIYGGFPCQDISVAGSGKGLGGERSGLFFEIVRLAKEIKPKFIFLENVPAIRTRGLGIVLQELTQAGYDTRWTMLSARDVGANHKRERWFLLAHTEGRGRSERNSHARGTSERNSHARGTSEGTSTPKERSGLTDGGVGMANTSGAGLSLGTTKERFQQLPAVCSLQTVADTSKWWDVEPNVGRVANGIPKRVDRLKCLGNAVVPLQVKTAFEILMGMRKTK